MHINWSDNPYVSLTRLCAPALPGWNSSLDFKPLSLDSGPGTDTSLTNAVNDQPNSLNVSVADNTEHSIEGDRASPDPVTLFHFVVAATCSRGYSYDDNTGTVSARCGVELVDAKANTVRASSLLL